jgi:glycosyltransferase involved in cell wall biosynthesis
MAYPVHRAMRILHVYKDYPPVIGGIENHIKTLAEGQAGRGLDVTVLVTNPNCRTVVGEAGGVRLVKAARLAEASSTPLSLAFFAWLRRLDAEVLHLHFPYPPGDVGHLLLARHRRLVISYHSDVVRQRLLLHLYRPVLWRTLASADAIIASSPAYVRTSPFLRNLTDKCRVIPMGIDPDGFASADRDAVGEIRREHGTPLLLFVGRLRYYKGLEYLLQAMAQIPAKLLIVGTGPQERRSRSLARRLGVTDRVSFLGDVTDAALPSYYHACDVFVLPSSHRSEAFGTVQLEAMAAARPVVSTELGTGTSYVNQNGLTGLVVHPRSPDALAGAINGLLADPGRRRTMGVAGRQRVQAEFSRDLMVERTIELYGQVLHRT